MLSLKNSLKTRQHAAFGLLDLKLASGSERTFTGYGSVFGNLDAHGDVIAKGAFSRSLEEHRQAGTWPVMLAQHGGFLGGDAMPIGVWTSIKEDDVGLKVEGYLSDTDRGREAHVLLKDKALSGLSIGYEVRQAVTGTRAGEPRRTLTEIDLWEVSLVTFPSNALARVSSVKLDSGQDFTVRDCERVLRDAGVPRALASAIVTKGWKAATGRRDDEGDEASAELAAALKAGAALLHKTINQRKEIGDAPPHA